MVYIVYILDARKEQTLLFDLFKAFHQIESSHKWDFWLRKDIFSFTRSQYVLSYSNIHMVLDQTSRLSAQYIFMLFD